MKKRKSGEMEAQCAAQFIPPMKINIFSSSGTDLGRWSLEHVAYGSSHSH